MLATIELNDSNESRIDSYVYTRGLRSYMYLSDPYYRVCLVECSSWDYCCLMLLS